MHGGQGHKRGEELDFVPGGMGSHGECIRGRGAWSELGTEIALWTRTGAIPGGRGCDLGVRGRSQARALGGMTSWDAVDGRDQELQTCAQASREFRMTIITPISQRRKWRARWIEPRFEPKEVWLQASRGCWDWPAPASSPGLEAAQAVGSGSGASPLPWGLRTGLSGQPGLADPPALA